MRLLLQQLVLVIGAWLLLSCYLHPIHISYTRVEAKGNSIYIASKIFSDDFLQQVQFYTKSTKVGEAEMQTYFNSVFRFPEYKGFLCVLDSVKIQNDAHWLYLHVTTTALPHSLTLQNSILCDLYDDQKNICIVKKGGDEEGFMFDYNSQLKSITITE